MVNNIEIKMTQSLCVCFISFNCCASKFATIKCKLSSIYHIIYHISHTHTLCEFITNWLCICNLLRVYFFIFYLLFEYYALIFVVVCVFCMMIIYLFIILGAFLGCDCFFSCYCCCCYSSCYSKYIVYRKTNKKMRHNWFLCRHIYSIIIII